MVVISPEIRGGTDGQAPARLPIPPSFSAAPLPALRASAMAVKGHCRRPIFHSQPRRTDERAAVRFDLARRARRRSGISRLGFPRRKGSCSSIMEEKRPSAEPSWARNAPGPFPEGDPPRSAARPVTSAAAPANDGCDSPSPPRITPRESAAPSRRAPAAPFLRGDASEVRPRPLDLRLDCRGEGVADRQVRMVTGYMRDHLDEERPGRPCSGPVPQPIPPTNRLPARHRPYAARLASRRMDRAGQGIAPRPAPAGDGDRARLG